MTESTGKRGSHVSERVLAFLKQHANVLVSITEICEATDLSRNSAASAISHLRERIGMNIETPMRGQYIYHTGKRQEIVARSGAMYEVVGTTGQYIIVRDEYGELFTISPLAAVIRKAE